MPTVPSFTLSCVLPFALALGACRSTPMPTHVTTLRGPTMGSHWEVLCAGGPPAATVRALVDAELAAFDATFSLWRDDSELARLNAHTSTAPFPVSERLAAVLRLALDVAAATDGAFDPTIRPLTALFQASKRGEPIEPAAWEAARARVDWRAVRVDGDGVHKSRPDVALDLDGLVAGAAADTIADRVAALGGRGVFVDVTGEIACRGTKANGEPWRAGVADPAADARGGDATWCTVVLRDGALCTSGVYRNAARVGGAWRHHVLDPRTGANPERLVVSASVLAPSAAVADAFDTAFLVLGDDAVAESWPRWRPFQLQGALLLVPGDGPGGLRAVEIQWPDDDS